MKSKAKNKQEERKMGEGGKEEFGGVGWGIERETMEKQRTKNEKNKDK